MNLTDSTPAPSAASDEARPEIDWAAVIDAHERSEAEREWPALESRLRSAYGNPARLSEIGAALIAEGSAPALVEQVQRCLAADAERARLERAEAQRRAEGERLIALSRVGARSLVTRAELLLLGKPEAHPFDLIATVRASLGLDLTTDEAALLLEDARHQMAEAEARRLERHRLGNWREVLTLAEEHDDSTDLVPRMLRRGDRVLITARPGRGKSTLFRQIAVQLAAGLWPFHPERRLPGGPVRVLYVDLENAPLDVSEAANDQLAALLPAGVVPVIRFEFREEGFNLVDSAEDQALLRGMVEEFAPDVLILGPLVNAAGALVDEGRATALIAYFNRLKADFECAIMIEAHPTKAVGSGSVRGSAALEGWAPFGFYLDPDGELTRFRPSRRADAGWPRKLRRGGEGEWPWVATEASPEDLLGYRIRECVELTGRTSRREIARWITERYPDGQAVSDSAVQRWKGRNQDAWARMVRDAEAREADESPSEDS